MLYMQYRWKSSFVIILHNNGENPELSTGEKHLRECFKIIL